MWSYRYLSRLDFRVIPIIFLLMLMSLLVISTNTSDRLPEGAEDSFFTPLVWNQIQRDLVGIGFYLFFAAFDYNKLREWTWILYIVMLIALIGLFFTAPIAGVHRWYRVPFLGNFQPSEYAKLIVVITLSWYLERKQAVAWAWKTVWGAFLIVGIPFLLILKQPDLGTSLVLFPVSLVMFYIGNLRPAIVKTMLGLAGAGLFLIALIFLGILPHETIRPYASKVLKEYQFDRLNPNTPHQHAASTAIAIGGIFGAGFKKGEFTRGGWLPASYTDSVFPAFGEEWGFVGLVLMLALFYGLLHYSFQVSTASKDPFGRLLSAGITVYLAVHILVNVGMMSGFLPITGVPLILVTYGGSSILLTMTALGILQSIYSRRFMF